MSSGNSPNVFAQFSTADANADTAWSVSTSAYDSLNRLVRSTKPDPYSDDTETAPLETISYDINGNVARKTDALGLESTICLNASRNVSGS